MDQATVSILVQAAGLAIIAWIQKMADAKMEQAKAETNAKREADAEWRTSVDKRMLEFESMLADQNAKMDSVLKNQLTNTRSDIIHKAHRYIDDLGRASTEEKDAFDAEYRDYSELCDAYGIKNDFIRNLHDQVMALPSRKI